MRGIILSILWVLLAILPLFGANAPPSLDDYWRRASGQSWQDTVAAYKKDPNKVVADLNARTKRHLEQMDEDKNRRELAGTGGGCKATNPIDGCWRCHPWDDKNRYRLAGCVLGFGQKAKGGKAGPIYVVTDPSDNNVADPKPGTLRYGVTRKGPLWITFRKDMVIKLQQELIVSSNKTIDGRGVHAQIAFGAGISIFHSSNVIIHGIYIHDIIPTGGGTIMSVVDYVGPRSASDGDGISIFGSQHIWIDHVTVSRCADGLIDAIQGSTAITISNCLFTEQDQTILLGAHDHYLEDKKMQVTIVYNHFGKKLVQGMPACRHGFIHIVNNDYIEWQMYAIGGSAAPIIVSQGNRFVASPTVKEVTHRDNAEKSVWSKWTWVTDGDMFMNGAFFVPAGDQNWHTKHPQINDSISPASATRVKELTQYAGVIRCYQKNSC